MNRCIKSGLNTFSQTSPPWQVCLVQSHHCLSLHIWGVVEKWQYVQLLGQIQKGVLSLWSVMGFYCKPDRNMPLWNQEWKGNMLQNTRLQRNGRQSPKSDDITNDLCTMIHWIRPRTRSTANSLVFLVSPTTTKTSKWVVFWMQMTEYGASRDFWKQSGSWMVVLVSLKSAAMDIFGRRRIDQPEEESSMLKWMLYHLRKR